MQFASAQSVSQPIPMALPAWDSVLSSFRQLAVPLATGNPFARFVTSAAQLLLNLAQLQMATLPRTPQPACQLAGRLQTLCATPSCRQLPRRQRRHATTAAALPPPATTAAVLADVLTLPGIGELQPWVLPAAGLGVAAAG